ncbi:MAG TPA: acyl-CoA dehydrogenase family protein [Myxococcales bacterium]|nr:acyl-CoA dehydrogenase family protein [Myxococcales bacterium]
MTAAPQAAPATSPAPTAQATGGSFLFQELGSTRGFFPEDFTEEQRLYYQTAAQFSREQILTRANEIEKKKDPQLLRKLLRMAGEVGLLTIDIPVAYGGLSLDKTTSALVAEAQSMLGAWSVTFGAHVGIGTLPIVWYGTPEQKARYLPKSATGEWAGAYALTETGSGSDALGARTRAVKSPDGAHWVLDGSKQFITNAAFADFFIVFAKVDGEKFTAFIVDRSSPGLTVGPEEHKMGIRGSSTCPLTFDGCRVPAGNLLGEIGKGHKIAFNILNVGRLKLGAGVLGGMKMQMANALRYAQERKQFQTPILRFPLIREKFARMAMLASAVESMVYRTTGLIDQKLASADKAAPDYDRRTIDAIEEFAIEASINKVFGSEALWLVVDEAVQVHGGYGFIEEFPVERAARDVRINRIFEGTNEINRMLISGMLLKRAVKGQLPLFEVAGSVADELAQGTLPRSGGADDLGPEAAAAEHLKWLALYALKVGAEAFGPEIEQHQEVLAAVADVVTDAFALESMVLRARQAAAARGAPLDPVQAALARLFAVEARSRSVAQARKALCASARGAQLDQHLSRIAPLCPFTPYDPVALRETVLARMEELGGYPVVAAST